MPGFQGETNTDWRSCSALTFKGDLNGYETYFHRCCYFFAQSPDCIYIYKKAFQSVFRVHMLFQELSGNLTEAGALLNTVELAAPRCRGRRKMGIAL